MSTTSTTRSGGTDHRARAGATRDGVRRLSTETKAAPKTTEFVLTVVVILGILLSALLIKGGDTSGGGDGGTDEFIARHAWLYVAIVTAGYSIARGLAKSGSREPYFDGGTNQDRDDR
jgi:hypothetical protein